MSSRQAPRARRQLVLEPASPASRAIDRVTGWLGSPAAVATAAAIVILWVAFGPLFGYADSYQLVINTATTIVTFVMVFAIQHTTNRETRAINLKLDELLEAVSGADEKLIGVEHASNSAIERLSQDERARAQNAGNGRRREGSRA
jgi:low affinity Fe/Cu permease